MKKSNEAMHKNLIVIAVAVVIVVAGVFFMKDRMGMIFSGKKIGGGDLIIANDTQDTASSAFMRDGKMVSQVMHAGEKTSGGRGLIRIFIAKKNGAYEIQYPFPRPAGKPTEVKLSQVLSVVHNPKTGEQLVTEKGKIDDILVNYEEVRDLEATY